MGFKIVYIIYAIKTFSSAAYSNGYIIGSSDNKRFGSYNLTNKTSVEKFEYPKGKGILSDQYCFQSHPSKNFVVGVQLYSKIISILEINNNNLHLKELVWWQNTNKQLQSGNEITKQISSLEDKNCFLDVATTKDYIYVLYSGKPYGNTKASVGKSYLSNLIYVFNWKGEPVKKFKLDKEVISITIDKKIRLYMQVLSKI
ncbi:hypothetical protein JL193_04460 [Polaribacter batillariae]|uniref:Uncharacterized protein n=1 Tax=Polaribacter batillariae TaxID=2808900 RepID=A0ABX7SYG9_9FLAO|nr:hypothetical protein JL193_04460 [Polaribacter batillariae]